jgi:hypothetical protein
MELCPKIVKNLRKMRYLGDFGFSGFWEEMGEKWEMGQTGGGVDGGEGPTVVSRWWGKWMPEVGWVDLDFREKKI